MGQVPISLFVRSVISGRKWGIEDGPARVRRACACEMRGHTLIVNIFFLTIHVTLLLFGISLPGPHAERHAPPLHLCWFSAYGDFPLSIHRYQHVSSKKTKENGSKISFRLKMLLCPFLRSMWHLE